ncbi:RDD family protein [Microbacterium sp. ZOR0019]|uniref:RDD family protein n=1 Tax=Microbacterium sp. ZOR0019 TaxID=1339233 RepID=UPI0006487113|nr:RDD family protein [Microbacterium sp. ZOR0019]
MTQPALDQIAPLSRRAVAYVIDALIAGGLAIVLGGGLLVAASLTGSVEGMVGVLLVGGPVVSLVLLGWFVVYTVMQAGAGSIGMRAQGVRLVAAADGGPLGFGRALLRNVIFGLAAAVVVGYFTPLFDGSGRFQGWHDKVAGSLILDARKAGPVGSASEAASSSSASAPGLATPTTGPAIPGLPQSVPAASAASAAPVAPAPPAPASSSLPPRPAAPPAPVAESGSLIAFVPGITQDAPSRSEPPAQPEPELDATVQQHPVAPVTPPAPPAPVAAPPVAAPPVPPLPVAPVPAVPEVVEQDDDLEETRISVPGHRLVFTWDDGTRVSVSRRTIFGRNPAPEEGATLVPVRDETLSLSKTHFEAAAETSGGWVRDRHSTNGMTIVRDGQRIACPAGQRVPVRLGDAIEIGDRIVTIGGYA